MYTKQQKESALSLYKQTGSVSETVRMFGYPTRKHLYHWIYEAKHPSAKKKENVPSARSNSPEHPRSPPVEIKLNAIYRCFELGESIKSVSEEIGYTRASIYAWRKRYLWGGSVALMNGKNIKSGMLAEGSLESLNPETQHLLSRINDMQMEIDILKKRSMY